MASLVYVIETPKLNSSFSVVRGITPAQAENISLEQAFLAIVTLESGEKMPSRFARLGNWRAPVTLGSLEAVVWDGSKAETYQPVKSESVDKDGKPLSDALYFGRDDEKGILLQYLDPSINVTGDPVSHTSTHHHERNMEHYDLLWGACEVWLRDRFTGQRKQARLEGLFSDDHLAVQLNWQHPIIAAEGPSAVLISTVPPNNKKDDHHYDHRPFRQLFPEVIGAYTRKTRGPSARG